MNTERLVVGLVDAARMLCVNTYAMQKMLEAGEIPAYKDGKNWKIPLSLLQKTIEDKALSETEKRRLDNGN